MGWSPGSFQFHPTASWHSLQSPHGISQRTTRTAEVSLEVLNPRISVDACKQRWLAAACNYLAWKKTAGVQWIPQPLRFRSMAFFEQTRPGSPGRQKCVCCAPLHSQTLPQHLQQDTWKKTAQLSIKGPCFMSRLNFKTCHQQRGFESYGDHGSARQWKGDVLSLHWLPANAMPRFRSISPQLCVFRLEAALKWKLGPMFTAVVANRLF